MHSDPATATRSDRALRLRLITLFVLDFAAYVPNFPEVGLETRPQTMVGAPLMVMYMVAIFLPLVAAGVAVKWQRLAPVGVWVCARGGSGSGRRLSPEPECVTWRRPHADRHVRRPPSHRQPWVAEAHRAVRQ